MKKGLFTCILLVLMSTPLFSQEWLTDFTLARQLASKEHKPILLVFQGSDWCAPCIKLDREVWSTDEFKAYAADRLVLVKADFPRRAKNALPEVQQKANSKLAETYNKTGIFPLVVILDETGQVLGKTSYNKMTPAAYIAHLESFKS